MKKVIGILLLVVVMVVMVATVLANDTTVKAEEFEGIVYDNDRYVVMDMLEDWCKSVGDTRALDRTFDENGYFRGCGILIANEFVDEFGVECNIDNMKQILAGNGITECSIVKAGYSDDYAVYKMEVKSEDVELGTVYEDNEWKSYYEGFMYFMVVYEN